MLSSATYVAVALNKYLWRTNDASMSHLMLFPAYFSDVISEDNQEEATGTSDQLNYTIVS